MILLSRLEHVPEALRGELHTLADTVGDDDAATMLGVSPETLAAAIAGQRLERVLRVQLAVMLSRAWKQLNVAHEVLVVPQAGNGELVYVDYARDDEFAVKVTHSMEHDGEVLARMLWRGDVPHGIHLDRGDVEQLRDRLTHLLDTWPRAEGPSDEILFRSVDTLGLSTRSGNCLFLLQVHLVGELVQKTPAELKRVRNFGRASLKEVEGVLAGMGLRLGMKLDETLLRELASRRTQGR